MGWGEAEIENRDNPHPPFAMDQITEFRSANEWERWLIGNHVKSKGVWIRMFKKDSDVPTVSNSEALDLALCYGWITGQSRPYDEKSWLNRYVPRRPKSIWSKINKERAKRLIKEGRMKPAGLAQIEAARRDGRWQRAYTPPQSSSASWRLRQRVAEKQEGNGFRRNTQQSERLLSCIQARERKDT
jgi:uncharacterized protein YdeI (YjbR/CyaY-like superfamily)